METNNRCGATSGTSGFDLARIEAKIRAKRTGQDQYVIRLGISARYIVREKQPMLGEYWHVYPDGMIIQGAQTSMDAKHTKGPWEAEQCAIHTPNFIVAYVDGPANNIKEAQANARLIASAPELLEALEEVMDNTDYSDAAWYDKALEVLKKATRP